MSETHPIYDAKLSEMDIAVFDLETTGLHSSKHAIIQIAAVKVDQSALSDDWMTFVDPGADYRPIPDFIQNFTGALSIEHRQLPHGPVVNFRVRSFVELNSREISLLENIVDLTLDLSIG